ncbi:MAG: hypothetical protein U0802_14765 [Candidatus Binatia bacterium]
MRTWRRAFDRIGGMQLAVAHEEAVAARSAARIGRLRDLLAARVAASCAAPQAQTLAAAAQAARCFAGDVYAQQAVTCATAAESQVVQGACVGGRVAGYPCNQVDLLAFLPLSAIGGGTSNDVWGWTDPLNGREYALLGRSSGMSVVDLGARRRSTSATCPPTPSTPPGAASRCTASPPSSARRAVTACRCSTCASCAARRRRR